MFLWFYIDCCGTAFSTRVFCHVDYAQFLIISNISFQQLNCRSVQSLLGFGFFLKESFSIAPLRAWPSPKKVRPCTHSLLLDWMEKSAPSYEATCDAHMHCSHVPTEAHGGGWEECLQASSKQMGQPAMTASRRHRRQGEPSQPSIIHGLLGCATRRGPQACHGEHVRAWSHIFVFKVPSCQTVRIVGMMVPDRRTVGHMILESLLDLPRKGRKENINHDAEKDHHFAVEFG